MSELESKLQKSNDLVMSSQDAIHRLTEELQDSGADIRRMQGVTEVRGGGTYTGWWCGGWRVGGRATDLLPRPRDSKMPDSS